MDYIEGLGHRLVTPAVDISAGAGVQVLFTIVTGQVLITEFFGVIGTVIGGAANNSSLELNPTAGTTEIIATALNTANYASGDMLGLTGFIADAMIPAATGGALEGMHLPFIAKPGTLELRATGANTGDVVWTLFYQPMDEGAYVIIGA